MTTWQIIEAEAPTWTDVEALGSWAALEALAWQVDAAGSAATSGSASARLVRAVAASGASSSAGSATPVRILRPAAAGASASVGSAAAYRTLRAVGAGAAVSSGSSGPTVPIRRAAAGGAAATAGSGAATVPLRRAAAAGTSATLGSAASLRVRRSALAPDAILAVTNLDGSPVSDIQDDPDAADALSVDRLVAGAATAIRVSFPTPPGANPLTVGPARQELRVLVRSR